MISLGRYTRCWEKYQEWLSPSGLAVLKIGPGKSANDDLDDVHLARADVVCFLGEGIAHLRKACGLAGATRDESPLPNDLDGSEPKSFREFFWLLRRNSHRMVDVQEMPDDAHVELSAAFPHLVQAENRLKMVCKLIEGPAPPVTDAAFEKSRRRLEDADARVISQKNEALRASLDFGKNPKSRNALGRMRGASLLYYEAEKAYARARKKF
jgi:hypothetical protein